MEQAELLDECIKKLGLPSDYALAKKLEITGSLLSAYRKGRVKFDEYACFKIAEILEKTPSSIIAQVQSKNAHSEAKRLYFKRFFSIAVLWITFAVVLVNYTPFLSTAYAHGIDGNHLNNITEPDIMRSGRNYLKRFWQWLKRTLMSDTLRVTGT